VRPERTRSREFRCPPVSNMKHFTAALFALAFALAAPIVHAAPAGSIEGSYDCDECHGFLTIQRASASELKVSLGVGGGSCGGEAPVTGRVRYAGGVLKVPYKLGRKQCFAQIEFTDGGASVTDSCVTVQDEEKSTCASLGTYTRRTQ
jgi:hypothetical protein